MARPGAENFPGRDEEAALEAPFQKLLESPVSERVGNVEEKKLAPLRSRHTQPVGGAGAELGVGPARLVQPIIGGLERPMGGDLRCRGRAVEGVGGDLPEGGDGLGRPHRVAAAVPRHRVSL